MTKNYPEIRNTTKSEPTQNQRGLTTLMVEISEFFIFYPLQNKKQFSRIYLTKRYSFQLLTPGANHDIT